MSQFVRGAAAWSLTLGEVAKLAEPLAKLGIEVAVLDPASSDQIMTSRHERLLSADFDRQAPWLDAIPMTQLVRGAAEWSMTLGKVAALAKPLAELGIEVADLDPVSFDHVMTSRHVRLLSRNFENDAPWLGAIPLSQLVRAAAEWSMPLGKVAALARPLADVGITVPELPPGVSEDRATVDALWFLRSAVEWDALYVDAWGVASTSVAARRDPIEFRSALMLLETLGFNVEDSLNYVNYSRPTGAES